MPHWLSTLIFSFLGTALAFIVFTRPITNITAHKVYHKLMRKVKADEDRFAKRKQV
jgi:hypothetical protein